MESCRWILAGIRPAAPSMHNHPCYWGSMWVWLIPGLNFSPAGALFHSLHTFFLRASTKCAWRQRFAEIVGRQASHHFLWSQSSSMFLLIATFLSGWKSVHSALFCSGILLQVISSAESVLLGRRDGGIISLPTHLFTHKTRRLMLNSSPHVSLLVC